MTRIGSSRSGSTASRWVRSGATGAPPMPFNTPSPALLYAAATVENLPIGAFNSSAISFRDEARCLRRRALYKRRRARTG